LSDLQFADRSEAVDYLFAELTPRFRTHWENGKKVAEGIVDAFAVISDDSGAAGVHRTVFAPKRWVIRNQDLAFIEALASILQGTVTGAALIASTGSIPLAALAPGIAVLAQLIKTGLALRAKGVTLNPMEFQVLCLLRESPHGLSAEGVLARLPSKAADDSAASIEVCLERLANYPARSGDIPLVWKTSDGVWRCKDV
jgi:hypothetical protein